MLTSTRIRLPSKVSFWYCRGCNESDVIITPGVPQPMVIVALTNLQKPWIAGCALSVTPWHLCAPPHRTPIVRGILVAIPVYSPLVKERHQAENSSNILMQQQ